jgi:hypothetical protein
MINQKSRMLLGLVAGLVLLFACASPNWSGLSEAQISEWKADGVGPEVAKNWIGKGFDAQDYKAWTTAGFTLDDASKWSSKKFTAIEAQAWKKAGFSLNDAEKSRDKGLTPIPADSTAAPATK